MSNMDCMTCHNTHVNDRGNQALYAQKCMNCHNTVNHNACTMKNLTAADKNRCIDCHMPAQASNAIMVQTATEKNALPYLVHTHRIAIYPIQLKKIQTFIKTIN